MSVWLLSKRQEKNASKDMLTGKVIMKNSMEFPQEIKNRTHHMIQSPTSVDTYIYLKKMKSLSQREVCIYLYPLKHYSQ